LKTTHNTKKSGTGRLSGKRTQVTQLKRYFSIALFAMLGFLILWLITRNQDTSEIWNEFKNAKLIWIFLAFTGGVIANYFRAIRWNLLISPLGETPKTSTTFYAQMTGYMANLAVPRLGEITRCATLAKYSKIPFNALAGTVVAERVFDVICLMVLIFLTIIFQFDFLKDFIDQYTLTPLISAVNGNFWLLSIIGVISLLAGLLLIKYIRRIDQDNKGIAGKLKRQALGFWKGVISLRSLQNKMLFLLLSIAIWGFYFLTVYLCFFALKGTSHLGVADGFTILVMGSLGVVAPVPGGVGTYHFMVITTLTELLGITAESATSYAYISHATQMVTVLILGGLSWLMLSLKIKINRIPA
jgi:glycosyltransferase 2 family protein